MSATVRDTDGELVLETSIEALIERNQERRETCRLLRAMAVGETLRVRLVESDDVVTVERRS
jgi:hypothetical protein